MARRQAISIIKMPVTWILIADSRRAQVYTRTQQKKRIPLASWSRRNRFAETSKFILAPILDMRWEAGSPDQYEKGRNATGMVFESASTARHMSEPHMDVRDELRAQFAHTIADQLNKARKEKTFDRLVLIAPAKMLGEIKQQLDKHVTRSVVAELPKDLTHYEGDMLEKYVREALAQASNP